MNPTTPRRSRTAAITTALAGAVTALTLGLGMGGAAAQAGAPAATATAPARTAAGLNFQQIVDRVVAQGYSDVREIERKSDKLYEVKARNAQGARVELDVDARSGEILHEEIKR